MPSQPNIQPSLARMEPPQRSRATSGALAAAGAVITPYERLLAGIDELAPAIAARAAEIEAGRQLPSDLVATLRSIGAFRMFVPRSHGGMELDLPSGLRVIQTLSRFDGSVGWCAMLGAGASLFAALLPRDVYDSIYRNGPDVIFAGSAQPAGTAESIDGNWRVNGRWPFASGCRHADWMLGNCVMKKDGKPLPGPAEGVPMLRACILPARNWRIEDTWHVAGLKGTGSSHIALEDASVPADHFFDIAEATPCIPGPHYYAVPQLLPIFHAVFDLGVAEGALRELVELANTGWQQQRATKPTRESEVFQYELGRIEADLRAAQAFCHAEAASLWRHATTGTLKDAALLDESTQSGIWISTTCTRVADACFSLGGGAALYDSSPLQRRMRDLRVAAQHAAVQQRHYVGAGVRLLGGGVRPPATGH
jgi:alkylation response protein AidB-like acyl-CoA dehydrogenase